MTSYKTGVNKPTLEEWLDNRLIIAIVDRGMNIC